MIQSQFSKRLMKRNFFWRTQRIWWTRQSTDTNMEVRQIHNPRTQIFFLTTSNDPISLRFGRNSVRSLDHFARRAIHQFRIKKFEMIEVSECEGTSSVENFGIEQLNHFCVLRRSNRRFVPFLLHFKTFLF